MVKKMSNPKPLAGSKLWSRTTSSPFIISTLTSNPKILSFENHIFFTCTFLKISCSAANQFQENRPWQVSDFICVIEFKDRPKFYVWISEKNHDFSGENRQCWGGYPPTVHSFEKLPFISVHEKYSFLEPLGDFQFNALLKSEIGSELREISWKKLVENSEKSGFFLQKK